jgi:hypothetical protein
MIDFQNLPYPAYLYHYPTVICLLPIPAYATARTNDHISDAPGEESSMPLLVGMTPKSQRQ